LLPEGRDSRQNPLDKREIFSPLPVTFRAIRFSQRRTGVAFDGVLAAAELEKGKKGPLAIA